VVDPRGRARQAGATQSGPTVDEWRRAAERSLYVFARTVLGYTFLSPTLHKPMAAWLEQVPPRRKLLLVPRGHGKSTLVCQALPLHLWIQPARTNRYRPGRPGTHERILLVGESVARVAENARVIRYHLERNQTLRTLWPHAVWARPPRKNWTDTELILPRSVPFPEPSLRAVGIEAATTGAHPSVILKDDLTTERAANEPATMALAIRWHRDSRALLANPNEDLEWITATRWAASDLVADILDDPTVAVNEKWRSIVDPTTGEPIWPEHPTYGNPEGRAQLKREHGPRFSLLYENALTQAGLLLFAPEHLQYAQLLPGEVLSPTANVVLPPPPARAPTVLGESPTIPGPRGPITLTWRDPPGTAAPAPMPLRYSPDDLSRDREARKRLACFRPPPGPLSGASAEPAA
jgi:hypothetical protein